MVRLNDLTQHLTISKMAIYSKNTEIATSMPSNTSFNVPIKIEFYKQGRHPYESSTWEYDMPDLGYNWSFSINLQDLEQLKHSRKEDYYPLCKSNEICGSTITKQ